MVAKCVNECNKSLDKLKLSGATVIDERFSIKGIYYYLGKWKVKCVS